MSNNAKQNPWNTQKTPTKHVLRLFKNFLKIWFSAQKSGSRLRCRTMLKNTLKHPENTSLTCFEAFWEILENPVLGWKIRFSAKISNYAKIPWNTQKTPTKHVLRLLKKFVKIRFSAQTSGSRLRCRTMLKIPWNTQKTPTKHVLRLFKKFLKIRFLAQKSGSRPKCRTMLKILWNTQKTPTNHALRHFKTFLKIRFLAENSGSRLRCRIMLKIPWNSQKTPTKHVWGFWEILENLVLCSKIRFSAIDVEQC